MAEFDDIGSVFAPGRDFDGEVQGQAIYQLGAFKIHNEETLDFTIEITPRGEDRPYIVKFRQQFFVD